MIDDLNDETFMIYAIKAYDKPNCVMSEFYEDLKRIKYVKRLFIKYHKSKEIKERLVINHLIVLYNVFGATAATRILFYKIDQKYYSILKTFLIFLNYMPKVITKVRGKTIRTTEIPVDLKLAEILRKQ
jgi:hypothetical protein